MMLKPLQDFSMDAVIGAAAPGHLPDDDFYLGERFDVHLHLAQMGSRSEKLYDEAVRLHAGHFSSESEQLEFLDFVQSHFLHQAEKLGDFFSLLNEGFAVRQKDRDQLDLIRVRLEKVRGLIAYQTNDLESLQEVNLQHIEAKRFKDKEERTRKLEQIIKKQKPPHQENSLSEESQQKLQEFERAQYLFEKRQNEERIRQVAWADLRTELKKWLLILSLALIPLSYFFAGRISPNDKILIDPAPYQKIMDFRAIYLKHNTLMVVVEADWASLYSREKDSQLRQIAKISPEKNIIVVDPAESLLADFKQGTLHLY